MKIHLVNYEASFNNGILSKFSNKLEEELKKIEDIEVSVSDKPNPKADINHHINYLPYKHTDTKNTLMITHIWEGYKLDSLKKSMETADIGICMSKDVKDNLVKWGIPEENLKVVLPAHDGNPRRHQVVAILTNVYPDGCKKAEMFTELARTLDNNSWAFRIMGSGWEDILVPLVAKGLQVDYFADFNYEVHKQILETSDYSLYFGNDEGSMGILDSANAGLKLIATNQGFHKEIGIDYPFETQEELNAVFAGLNNNRVKDWTWYMYARNHVSIWRKLLK